MSTLVSVSGIRFGEFVPNHHQEVKCITPGSLVTIVPDSWEVGYFGGKPLDKLMVYVRPAPGTKAYSDEQVDTWAKDESIGVLAKHLFHPNSIPP